MKTNPDFFATLAMLHQSKHCGALFGITDSHRMLIAGFDTGNITSMRFGRLNGVKVLDVLQDIDFQSLSITPSLPKAMTVQDELPDTRNILDGLSSRIPKDVLAAVLKQAEDTLAPEPMQQGQTMQNLYAIHIEQHRSKSGYRDLKRRR